MNAVQSTCTLADVAIYSHYPAVGVGVLPRETRRQLFSLWRGTALKCSSGAVSRGESSAHDCLKITSSSLLFQLHIERSNCKLWSSARNSEASIMCCKRAKHDHCC